ncbi:uncharacterized protein METZ01_LOCUS38751 [marine metagenome]|uniref:Uncharacterized protein n=1 Tax=marine metagenome TaxID=408172 RepID=A0A381R7P8_9ZZZZ
MAGVVGFEPTHHGIKTRCLTAWLHPKSIQPNHSDVGYMDCQASI